MTSIPSVCPRSGWPGVLKYSNEFVLPLFLFETQELVNLHATDSTERLQVVHGHFETKEVKHHVLQRARVSVRQDEAIAVRPMRVLGVRTDKMREEDVRHRSASHGGAWMARVGTACNIGSQSANRINTECISVAKHNREGKRKVCAGGREKGIGRTRMKFYKHLLSSVFTKHGFTRENWRGKNTLSPYTKNYFSPRLSRCAIKTTIPTEKEEHPIIGMMLEVWPRDLLLYRIFNLAFCSQITARWFLIHLFLRSFWKSLCACEIELWLGYCISFESAKNLTDERKSHFLLWGNDVTLCAGRFSTAKKPSSTLESLFREFGRAHLWE